MGRWVAAALPVALLATGCGHLGVGRAEGGPLSHLGRDDGFAAVTLDDVAPDGRAVVSSQVYSIACTTGEPATITGIETQTEGDVRGVRVWLGQIDRGRGDSPGSYIGTLPDLDEPYVRGADITVGRGWGDAVSEVVDRSCRPDDLRGAVLGRRTMVGTLATLGPGGGRVREIHVEYTAGGRDWVVTLADPQVIRPGPACRARCARL